MCELCETIKEISSLDDFTYHCLFVEVEPMRFDDVACDEKGKQQ